jgi:hypothetical protein
MKIWEPKPPGTLWATPGLSWDPFNFISNFFEKKSNIIYKIHVMFLLEGVETE